MLDVARRSKRYPSDQPLLVSCESWHDFVALYAGDIGQGGMFILTDDPPPLMSTLHIRLQLPEATEIALHGRVVHVITREQAEAEKKQAGAGIEFVEMDAERKRQIVQLIEFARWQGASGDSSASFERTMMELSQQTPSTNPQSRATPAAGTERPAQRPPSMQNSAVTSRSTIERDVRKTTRDGEPRPAAKQDPRRITLDGEQKSIHPEDQQFSLRPDAGKKRSDSRRSVPAIPAAAVPGSSAAPADAAAKPVSDKPVTSARPTDPVQLKVVVTHFAHKRYDQALKVLCEMLAANPGDPQALKWQHMCGARVALTKNDGQTAVQEYEKALTYDETNHEAREFARTYYRDKRLNALPFGRYFVKKK
ncbi:MAG TPA: PilZ domain-containing protein [Polyangiales bacterium]